MSAAELPRLKADFDQLARRATAWITDEQKFAGPYVLQPAADMRYQGQSFEIEVPLQLDWIATGDWQRIAAAFHAQHDRLYGHSSADGAGPTGQPAHGGGGHLAAAAIPGAAAAQPARPRPPSRSRCTSTAPGVPCRFTGGPTWTRPASRQPLRRGAGRYDDLRAAGFTGAVDAYGNILLSLDIHEGTRDAHRPGHPADLRQSRAGGRRQHGVHAVPHGALDLREGNRGLHHRPGHARRHDLRQPARSRRHLVHRPRLRQRACAWSKRLPAGRHLHHQRSLQRLRLHPHARPAHVEADLLGGRAGRLLGQPHPQHRRGRRGAGIAVAAADRGPPGRHPHPAEQALRPGRAERGAARR